MLETRAASPNFGVMNALPPRIEPPTRPLSLLQSLAAARRNVLGIIPALAYVQPMLSGRLGSRWHMVQDPGALRRIFLDNATNYPKAEFMLRMLRPAVGDSLFTVEGEEWRWQRRAVAPVFAQRNVTALAPVMTATAERAAARIAAAEDQTEMVAEMLSATFDVICDVALSGREHFDAAAYGAAIIRYFETVGRASMLDFLHVPSWVPRPDAILGRGSVRTMHAMVARAIDERRRSTTYGAIGGADDLLDHMLKAEDPETGRRMTPEELLHNMQFFIVAGHETTALALAWSLLLLAGDRDAQARARGGPGGARRHAGGGRAYRAHALRPPGDRGGDAALPAGRHAGAQRARARSARRARGAAGGPAVPAYLRPAPAPDVVGPARRLRPGQLRPRAGGEAGPLPAPALRRRAADLRRRQLRDDAGAYHPCHPAGPVPFRPRRQPAARAGDDDDPAPGRRGETGGHADLSDFRHCR